VDKEVPVVRPLDDVQLDGSAGGEIEFLGCIRHTNDYLAETRLTLRQQRS
jgi:hypothetical protein